MRAKNKISLRYRIDRRLVFLMLKKLKTVFKGLDIDNGIRKTTGVFLLFFVMLFILAITQSQFRNIELEVGEKASEDIKAPYRIEDLGTYEAQVNEAMKNMESVYRISPTIQITSKAKISGYLDLVRDVKLRNNLSEKGKSDELEIKSPIELSTDIHQAAIDSTFSSLNTVEAITEDLLSQILAQGIREDELGYQLREIDSIVNSLNLEDKEQLLVASILNEIVEPNEFVDTIATERQMERVRSSIITPVIEQNEIIVNKGDVISTEQMRIIEIAQLENRETGSWLRYIGITIHLLMPLIALMLYFIYFYPEVLRGRLVYLVFSSLLITLFLGRVMEYISPYLIPSAINAIVVTLMVGPGVAIITNMVLVYILNFMWSIPGELVVVMLIGNSAGILLLVHQNQRHRVLLNGLYMGLIGFIVYLGYFFLGNFSTRDLIVNGGLVIISGLVSGIITLGTLPLWENLFNVLTPLKLMELTDPNQPILRRLFVEAPGTYHHSLIVGSLSESAAASIGANQLLAKAGAYYHDIGKLKRPAYFKENQFGIDNPHDDLEPLQSTQIIISHWEDGMKLGKETKLPREIMDIIDQHHGKTLISYFYHKAAEDNQNIPEKDFRYGGEKPKSRESTIVMLADSVEAAVRSIKDMKADSIEKMVKKIIKGKIDDGQLEESPITAKEINTISETFISVLKGIYHERIEYPEKS
ncbi:HD family phosphohydrolase [Gudongella sp. DL1XJH-153]|uniref:HD family phosphohydrolase n=1 Tax=Gudongella sp. DL1XJH-153 TaxID=3409804 RepID=UPI003BB499CD